MAPKKDESPSSYSDFQGNLENLSKEMEVEDEESDSESDKLGVGRTYECNFCKRGFTNAQALGGHMNIHRKDKAKARQQQHQHHHQKQPPIPFSYPSSASYKPSMDPMSTYAPSFATQRNYQECYPFASNNNNNPSCYFSQPSILEGNEQNFRNRRTGFFETYENQLGSNLNLTMSSSSIDRHQGGEEKNKKEGDYDDIDLELRLGYDR